MLKRISVELYPMTPTVVPQALRFVDGAAVVRAVGVHISSAPGRLLFSRGGDTWPGEGVTGYVDIPRAPFFEQITNVYIPIQAQPGTRDLVLTLDRPGMVVDLAVIDLWLEE